eukprot:2171852-Pyramimonas_sp.AAC.1
MRLRWFSTGLEIDVELAIDFERDLYSRGGACVYDGFGRLRHRLRACEGLQERDLPPRAAQASTMASTDFEIDVDFAIDFQIHLYSKG